MSVPVHIVGGFLGTGKTTLLQRELARRGERCAVVVNDFGEARIDASLLGGAVAVRDIAGGCLCCTAPEGLAPALGAILDEIRPDRIFIEPSGLARPADLVDMLQRAGLRERVRVMPIVVLVDPTAQHPDPLEGADVVVLSHVDLASREQVAAARARVEALWPRPRVYEGSHGVVDEAAWDWPPGPRELVFSPPVEGGDSTVGYAARSWIFPPEVVFSWDGLKRLVVGTPKLARLKGVFRTDLGWYRVDVAGGRFLPGQTAWRSDSRCDCIVAGGDLDAFGVGLEACREADTAVDDDGIELVDAAGLRFPLSRGVLRALPGQVADVGTVVAGRSGAGVALREILQLARGEHYVVTARDGMTSAPAAVAEVGDAVLVHSLGGGVLPAEQGGPFRLLAPKGSSCANVKGVATIRVLG